MKKLELKTPIVNKPEMQATLIRNNAMESIKDFAFYEAEMLYKLIHGDTPNYGKGEEIIIFAGDLKRDVFINVLTDRSKFDTFETNYVLQKVDKIIVQCDKSIIVGDKDGNEWYGWELGFDEIVDIVNALQEAYEAKVKE